MSLKTFQDRYPDNTPGKFYVDYQCLDCDLCRETAPTVFARNDEDGSSYVIKQPENSEELEQARESLEGCPCEAVFDDGDQFDWNSELNNVIPQWRIGDKPKPQCSHCQKKPWWKLW